MATNDSKDGQQKKLKFMFEYDKDYRVVAANGVWGGSTPRGDFQLDFFVEKAVTPTHIVNAVTDEGLGAELGREPAIDSTERSVARRLQVGVLLSLDHAESIADYIKTRVGEFRAQLEQLKKDK